MDDVDDVDHMTTAAGSSPARSVVILPIAMPDPTTDAHDSADPRAMTWTLTPELEVLALKTPTLPPATATNTVFFGSEPFIVDPATPFDAERGHLLAAIEARRAAGRPPRAIVLTHHHVDHVGAATWLSAAAAIPIWAHPRTAELLAGRVAVDHTIDAGDRFAGWTVHHTPGHASGHIVLHHEHDGHLIAGDMVATIGTIIVDPPDGHMASYLASLRLMRDLGARLLIPAHGEPIRGATAVAAHLTHYITHREAREALVHAALAPGPRTLDEITHDAYPELAPALMPLARRSALAHLEKLAEEGHAAHADGLWRPVTLRPIPP